MATKTPMIFDVSAASGMGKLQTGDTLTPNSLPAIKPANAIYVDNSGNDTTGDGSINRPYQTIGKALLIAQPNQDSIIVGNGTYTENLTLVGGIPINADISSIPQQVTITGNHTLPVSGLVSFSYIIFNCPSGYLFSESSTSSSRNLMIESCTMNIQSGASGCFNYTTTNSNARANLLNSVINIFGTSGYAINCNGSVAGKINLQYTSVQSLINQNNIIINLTGALTVTHTFDVIVGQIVVAGSSAYNGTSLNMITGNTPVLTTNSSGTSSLGLCSINTTSTNAVTGAGIFVYAFIGYTNTGCTLNNTLNGGAGAISGLSAPLRIDTSALPPTPQPGLLNFDGTNFYADLSTSNRARIATSDKTTGIIPTTQLPVGTGANQLVQLNGTAQIPAVNSGITLVTDPTTSSTTSLNTALANINNNNGNSKDYATSWGFGGGSYEIGTTQIIPVVNINFKSSSNISISPTLSLWVQNNIIQGSFYSISYGNGIWVAGNGNTGLYYSSDGITWTQSNIASGGFSKLYYANNLWLALGNSSNGIYYSTNGQTWTQSSLGGGYSLTSVYYANNLWVCTSLSNGLYYSSNGINWTGVPAISGNFYSISYGNGTWIAGSGSLGLWYSSNGTTWTQSNITSGAFQFTYFGNNLFVASSGTGLYYSTNGQTWTQSNITSGLFFTVYYANNLWITSSTENGLYYSTNGQTWTQSNITSGAFYSILYNNTLNQWVVGGANNNGIYYSTNGQTWTQSNNIINANVFSLTSDNSSQVVAGTNNGIYYSTSTIVLANNTTYRIRSNIALSAGICTIRHVGVNGTLNGSSQNTFFNGTNIVNSTIINNSSIFITGNSNNSSVFLEIKVPNSSLLPAIVDSNNVIFEIEEM